MTETKIGREPSEAEDRLGSADPELESGRHAQRLAEYCAAYQGADAKRSLIQVVGTALSFAALCAGIFLCIERAPWAIPFLTLPAAGMLVRLFIIQHDCGHGSFFESRAMNDLLGRLISVATMTPYGYWRRAHAQHHATSGDLSRRGFGDITTLTVEEYRELSLGRRVAYRLYRNPVVLLVFGPPFHFMIGQRSPWSTPYSFCEVWKSVLSLNLGAVIVYGLVVSVVGWKPLLITYLPVMVIASCAGGWLFFVQHQFADTYWAQGDDWDFHASALKGSSYYVLPRIFCWFTGNIGLHHIHHLCGKIPNYRLQECLDGSPELRQTSRLNFRQSLRCIRLTLWDEAKGKLVGFRELKTA